MRIEKQSPSPSLFNKLSFDKNLQIDSVKKSKLFRALEERGARLATLQSGIYIQNSLIKLK